MATQYGTAHIETARDKIVTQLTALQTAMATGYDPVIGYIYDYHNVAKLQLNAVSVEAGEFTPDDIGTGGNMLLEQYPVPVSIRVHTAYDGGHYDHEKTIRLMNSVINYLNAHKDLSGGYRLMSIQSVNPRATFEDSKTIGGEVIAVVTVYTRYTQG